MLADFTFSPGWDIKIPAGTRLIRADIAFVRRPGPGGFCALIESSDLMSLRLIRGGMTDATTPALINELLYHLAHEIKDRRAVILVRNRIVQDHLAEKLRPYRLIRILGPMPLAVADATRNAAVMAERCDHIDRRDIEHFEINRRDYTDEPLDKTDAGPIQTSLEMVIKAIPPQSLDNPKIRERVERVLDAAHTSVKRTLSKIIQKTTAHDVPVNEQAKE